MSTETMERKETFPEDIQQCQDLEEECKDTIRGIQAQLAAFRDGHLPERNTAWRRSAVSALNHYSRSLSLIKNHMAQLKSSFKDERLQASVDRRVQNARAAQLREVAKNRVILKFCRGILSHADMDRLYDAIDAAQAELEET